MDNPQPLISEDALKHWMRDWACVYYCRDRKDGSLYTCNSKAMDWLAWRDDQLILVARVKVWKIKFKLFD